MGLLQVLSDPTGCGKSNMAASKPEIPMSQLPGEIETKFQRLNLHFPNPAIEWDYCKYCPTKPDVVNSIWRPPTGINNNNNNNNRLLKPMIYRISFYKAYNTIMCK